MTFTFFFVPPESLPVLFRYSSGFHSVPIQLCNKEQSVPFLKHLLLPLLPLGSAAVDDTKQLNIKASYQPFVSHELLGTLGKGLNHLLKGSIQINVLFQSALTLAVCDICFV